MKLGVLLLLLLVFISCNEKREESQDNTRKEIELTPKDSIPPKPKDTEVWEPEPQQIGFNENNIPSDAIVLFNGSNLSSWVSAVDSISPAPWTLNPDMTMTVAPKTGAIQTRANFGSIQLHLEWKAPSEEDGSGQGRGNSGIFLQNLYEVQILDSYDNRTYSNGQAASIYKQSIPLVNATKPPIEWQSYDIIYHQPEFDKDGKQTKAATITILHNGVLVQDHVTILGTTEYLGQPKIKAHGAAPIQLQDHGNRVSFRNIWVRKL